MYEWLEGLQKSSTRLSSGVAPEEIRRAETECGVPFPEELARMYEAFDGGAFQGDVTLFPLHGPEGTPSVLEKTRLKLVGLPAAGVWRIGLKGAHRQLFSARKSAMEEQAESPLPGWVKELSGDEWLYGTLETETGELRLYRSLRTMMEVLVPPAEVEEFGDKTYARALSAVQGALSGLDLEEEAPEEERAEAEEEEAPEEERAEAEEEEAPEEEAAAETELRQPVVAAAERRMKRLQQPAAEAEVVPRAKRAVKKAATGAKRAVKKAATGAKRAVKKTAAAVTRKVAVSTKKAPAKKAPAKKATAKKAAARKAPAKKAPAKKAPAKKATAKKAAARKAPAKKATAKKVAARKAPTKKTAAKKAPAKKAGAKRTPSRKAVSARRSAPARRTTTGRAASRRQR